MEFDYPERFVQDQVGHAYASTTAIYTGVSDEYRNRLRSWPGPGLACQSCYKDACRQPCAVSGIRQTANMRTARSQATAKGKSPRSGGMRLFDRTLQT